MNEELTLLNTAELLILIPLNWTQLEVASKQDDRHLLSLHNGGIVPYALCKTLFCTFQYKEHF